MLELLEVVLAYKPPSELLWIFIVGIFISFAMGFATGANDVANTFGTSVGSGALTLRKAMIIAGICEFLGAVSLGSLVAKTIAGGIADPVCFVGSEGLLMAGMLSALAAAAIWLILASLLGLPVSTTHSIVGAIVGMAVATKGAGCVKWGWGGMANIAISWVTSPILSGLVAFGIYWAILKYIIHGEHPVENSFKALPFAFAFTSAVLLFLVSKSILTKYLSTWVLLLIVAAISITLGVAAKFFFVPWMRRQPGLFSSVAPINQKQSDKAIPLQDLQTEGDDSKSVPAGDQTNVPLEEEEKAAAGDTDDEGAGSALHAGKRSNSDENLLEDVEEGESLQHAHERHKARNLFFHVQLFSASLGAFAHGANDTANAIGPFAAIFAIWQQLDFVKVEIPIWMIVLGGASIVAGLAILGHKVIQTMGTDMTHIDYVNGFTTELCSGLTVVLASALSVPVSSTHCQVGAIVGVGLVGDKDKTHLENSGVNWKLFGKIFASWLITVPFSALVAGIIAWLLSYAVTLPRGSEAPLMAPFADNTSIPIQTPVPAP